VHSHFALLYYRRCTLETSCGSYTASQRETNGHACGRFKNNTRSKLGRRPICTCCGYIKAAATLNIYSVQREHRRRRVKILLYTHLLHYILYLYIYIANDLTLFSFVSHCSRNPRNVQRLQRRHRGKQTNKQTNKLKKTTIIILFSKGGEPFFFVGAPIHPLSVRLENDG